GARLGRAPRTIRTALTSALDRDPEVFATLYSALVDGRHPASAGDVLHSEPGRHVHARHAPQAVPDHDTRGPPTRRRCIRACCGGWPALNVVAVDVNMVTLGFLGAALHRGEHHNIQLVHADYHLAHRPAATSLSLSLSLSPRTSWARR